MDEEGHGWRRVRLGAWEGLFRRGPDGEGPLCTPEQYAESEDSYAYVLWDGRILRYQREIGRASDLVDLGPAGEPELEVSPIEHMRRSWERIAEALNG